MYARIVVSGSKQSRTLLRMLVGIACAAVVVVAVPFLALAVDSFALEDEGDPLPIPQPEETHPEEGTDGQDPAISGDVDTDDQVPDAGFEDEAQPEVNKHDKEPGAESEDGGTAISSDAGQNIRTGLPGAPTQNMVTIYQSYFEGFVDADGLRCGVEVDVDGSFSKPMRFESTRQAESPFVVELTGLQKATRYYYRSFVSADDRTAYGEVLRLFTLPDPQ